MEPIYEYTIKLIRYVLNGDVPELPEEIDFEKLFEFGKSHGVENMLYVGLRDLKIDVPVDTMKKFQTAYEMQIMVEATQALEFDAIAEEFEKQKIDFVTFKGTVLRYLYPMPDYRKSGDVDILVRKNDVERADNVMHRYGYKNMEIFENYHVHNGYTKPPFMEIEIHRQLVKDTNHAYGFCKKAWNYVRLKDGWKHWYEFSNEFMYTYLLAHFCNHLYMGGAGIRIVMDFWVVKQKISFDKKFLAKYIKRAGLDDINRMVVNLNEKWFGNTFKEDQDVAVLENIVLRNGSFGTIEMKNAMVSSMSRGAKLEHFIHRLFPPVRLLKNRYPVLEKYRWLLLVMWIYRMFDIGIFERNTIKGKIEESFESDNCIDDIKNVVQAVRDKK